MKKQKLNLWLGMLVAVLNHKIIKFFQNGINNKVIFRKSLMIALVVCGTLMLFVTVSKIEPPHQKNSAISEIAETANLEPLQSITFKNPPFGKEATATDAEAPKKIEVTATDAETSKVEKSATDAETQAETAETETETEAETEPVTEHETEAETEPVTEHETEALIFPTFLDLSKAKEANINLEDLYWLAHIIFAENGSNTDLCQIYTGLVIVNRKLHAEYPNTIKDVIFSPGQYSAVDEGKIWEEPSEEAWQIAWDILSGNTEKIPENVVYQAMFIQGSGIFKEIDGEYFCYY